MLADFVNWANGFLWGLPMLVVIIGSGVCFTLAPRGFQFVRFTDMWKRILDSGDSESGIVADLSGGSAGGLSGVFAFQAGVARAVHVAA